MDDGCHNTFTAAGVHAAFSEHRQRGRRPESVLANGGQSRRGWLRAAGAACLLPSLQACAGLSTRAGLPDRRTGTAAGGGSAVTPSTGSLVHAWEPRLQGDAVALLGEVHDNAGHHRLRTALLRRACAAGWRPALVMEQFDIDRQADLDRARRLASGDPSRLIALATTAAPGGWDWRHYEAVIGVALEHGLPLQAGNLSAAMTSRIVRGGLASVLDAERIAALGLARPRDAAWQAAQQREIDTGHCGALPAEALPRMAEAQFARDAVMAEAMRLHAHRGVVLLAGNGHVRRDIGVPRWLGDLDAARVWSVGFLESPDPAAAMPYDAVIVTAPAERPDPCLAFRRR